MTSTSAHITRDRDGAASPGPWYFEAENGKRHPRVYAADNSLVAEVGNAVLMRWEEWDPNARLIAAAPEMLAALKGLVDPLPEPAKGEDVLAKIEAARAAIAKAEGRE